MYTYTLNGNAVHPRGEWEIEYRRNAGQIFWRRYLVGELTFQDEDYTLIMGMTDCTVLTFIINCMGVEYWTGEFRMPYDFKIDEDQCNLKGTPKVVDEYSCIMENYETEWIFDTIYLVGAGVTADVIPCVGGAALATIQNGHTIYEYLDKIINNVQLMYCNLNIVSSFFWRDNFPNGDNYAAAYGVNNYITGAANRLEYIYLYLNSQIRSDVGGNPCPGFELLFDWKFGFKLFESLLRNRFNAYWYIDQNGDFRIEHISFFMPGFAHSDFGTAYDLTAIISENSTSYAYQRNKYRYLIDQLFDQERWEWQHYLDTEGGVVHGADFEGEPIYYGAAAGAKSDCVPGEFKEKVISTPLFWSDIEWATGLVAPDDYIDCRGFLMADIDLVPAPDEVNCEQGSLTGVNNINAHCSTANLMAHYFTWDRIFLTGHMNNGATPPAMEIVNFDSAIRKRLQDSITFPYCCDDDFSEFDYMTTHMGLGAPYSLKLNKNSITTELLYD